MFQNDDVLFQTFDDKGEDKSLAKQHHTDADLKSYNDRGAGVFFCVNHVPVGLGRSNTSVDRVRYNFVDLDEDGINKLEKVLHTVPLPDVIVRSSPGKFHCYWKAIDMSLREFRSYQELLIKNFGGDKSIKDLARVMRLPGFVHHKGEPYQVRWLGSGAYVKSRPSLWREA